MTEQFPITEINQSITKEEVINAYRNFVKKGITNPDALDENDPEVAKAHNLFYKWIAQEDARVEAEEAKENGDQELYYRVNLAKTMLYVDAGFIDPTYLNDILGQLTQDAQSAEKKSDNRERIATRQQITEAILKVRSLLAPQPE